jgi:hypothetical protein
MLMKYFVTPNDIFRYRTTTVVGIGLGKDGKVIPEEAVIARSWQKK